MGTQVSIDSQPGPNHALGTSLPPSVQRSWVDNNTFPPELELVRDFPERAHSIHNRCLSASPGRISRQVHVRLKGPASLGLTANPRLDAGNAAGDLPLMSLPGLDRLNLFVDVFPLHLGLALHADRFLRGLAAKHTNPPLAGFLGLGRMVRRLFHKSSSDSPGHPELEGSPRCLIRRRHSPRESSRYSFAFAWFRAGAGSSEPKTAVSHWSTVSFFSRAFDTGWSRNLFPPPIRTASTVNPRR